MPTANCLSKGVIYQPTVTITTNKNEETYVELLQKIALKPDGTATNQLSKRHQQN